VAILKNCEIWYTKLDPERPNDRYDKKNPKWELQLRTTDKAQKDEWTLLGLRVTAKIPDPDENGEQAPPYYAASVRKSSVGKTGKPKGPVEVVDGEMYPVDPKTIGNGSIANIRVFQYESPDPDTGELRTRSVLMGVQLTKLRIYVPKPRTDGFTATETERIEPEDSNSEGFSPGSTVIGVKVPHSDPDY